MSPPPFIPANAGALILWNTAAFSKSLKYVSEGLIVSQLVNVSNPSEAEVAS